MIMLKNLFRCKTYHVSKPQENTSATSQKYQFIRWIIPLWFLSASCLTPIYTVPFFAAISRVKSLNNQDNNQTLKASLNTTLFDTFEKLSDSCQDFNWIKIVFFIGFAFSQFTVGFLGDNFGKWKIFKILIKVLIVSGILAILSRCIYEFTIFWMMVSYASTASYLLIVCTVLQSADAIFEGVTYRLVVGLAFQMNWSCARLFANLVVYLCYDWQTVLLVLTVTITMMFFLFKNLLWKSHIVINYSGDYSSSQEKIFNFDFQELKNDIKFSYRNIIILMLTWFTLGYNYYGTMNTWRYISRNGKIFDHNILASLLATFSKILALMVCISVKRKRLPLVVMQVLTGICYLSLLCFDLNNPRMKYFQIYYIVHMSAFFETSAFALVWVMTPECFPSRYRTSCVGLCSGFARIGAIVGIIFGELKVLHHYEPILILAGILAMLSGVLIPFLPEMTKSKMPNTYLDIQKVQFRTLFNKKEEDVENSNAATHSS